MTSHGGAMVGGHGSSLIRCSRAPNATGKGRGGLGAHHESIAGVLVVQASFGDACHVQQWLWKKMATGEV